MDMVDNVTERAKIVLIEMNISSKMESGSFLYGLDMAFNYPYMGRGRGACRI